MKFNGPSKEAFPPAELIPIALGMITLGTAINKAQSAIKTLDDEGLQDALYSMQYAFRITQRALKARYPIEGMESDA